MRILQLVMTLSVVLAGLGRSARASGPVLVVEEPADRFLSFDHVPFDGQSAPQRIRIRNDGDPVGFRDITADFPFVIVATGGGLATGEEQYWDVACAPVDPDPNTGFFEVDVCGTSCSDDEWIEFLDLFCHAGLLDTTSTLVVISSYAYETGREIVPFTNPGPAPLTITGFAGHDPALSGELASVKLPVTLAAGESVDVVAKFDSTGPDVTAYFDVVAGPDIAGRVLAEGVTRNQIIPSGFFRGTVPRGAVYTIPITVRNSFPSARTITVATSDLVDYTVSGLVGTTLAPGELARGIVTFTAATLGDRLGHVTVAFDRGQGNTMFLEAIVVPPTFSLTTDDGTPHDGRLDFGTRKAGSKPVEKNFTITNLTNVAQPVSGCDSPSPPFALMGACPTMLQPHGHVRLTVRFTPTTVGDYLDIAGLTPGVGDFFSLISARVVAHQLAFSGPEGPLPATVQASDPQVPVGDPVPHALTAVGETVSPEDQPHHDGGCSTGGAASGSGGAGLAIAVLALARRRRRNSAWCRCPHAIGGVARATQRGHALPLPLRFAA